ncbi:conserved protein of unknown function [Rhodovastum atsumiense]|uniref:DUF707 domain-containing protein n=1 Tax=Rhodovastum atsumiense TaxID=504468 RepID=A0A5M6J0W5_9PROT|nr:DUF707 domain-containing protein [Rhodovastum atsumiense]KAA5613295.1 DUF707 domain-containing protein [Rhodovastum atsumiense]CAH2600536.1 conserved protein of unknown function [Rhodovastum atsumiense]
MAARDNLVIVRAGDASLHPAWLAGATRRNWDLVVSYYGDDPDRFRAPDVLRLDTKGPKWPALHALLTRHPEFTTGYRYIWLPDDDLMTCGAEIDRMFDICRDWQLEVAQPALTWNSYISHPITLRNAGTLLRFTDFVEIMAPCLSAPTLQRALPLFDASLSGWGIDHAWPRIVHDPARGIAVIDAVSVRHTRPVGGPNYQSLRAAGLSADEEKARFCEALGLAHDVKPRTHAAVARNGTPLRPTMGRMELTLRLLLGTLPSLWHTPMARRPLAREILRGSWRTASKPPAAPATADPAVHHAD